MRGLLSGGAEPSDRIVKLQLGVKWEVGEGGVGGGLKFGDAMDTGSLGIVCRRLTCYSAELTFRIQHVWTLRGSFKRQPRYMPPTLPVCIPLRCSRHLGSPSSRSTSHRSSNETAQLHLCHCRSRCRYGRKLRH
jgi:hypothetical protein